METRTINITESHFRLIKRALRFLQPHVDGDCADELNLLLSELPDWKVLPLSSVEFGRLGGKARSEAKVEAARRNAKTRVQRGGRPSAGKEYRIRFADGSEELFAGSLTTAQRRARQVRPGVGQWFIERKIVDGKRAHWENVKDAGDYPEEE